MQRIQLYLDNPCGWHTYLVVKEGRRLARVICTEDGAAYTISKDVLRCGRALPGRRPRWIARRLRAAAKAFGNDSKTLKLALAQLRALANPPPAGLDP